MYMCNTSDVPCQKPVIRHVHAVDCVGGLWAAWPVRACHVGVLCSSGASVEAEHSCALVTCPISDKGVRAAS
jgi:hypothetical protein